MSRERWSRRWQKAEVKKKGLFAMKSCTKGDTFSAWRRGNVALCIHGLISTAICLQSFDDAEEFVWISKLWWSNRQRKSAYPAPFLRLLCYSTDRKSECGVAPPNERTHHSYTHARAHEPMYFSQFSAETDSTVCRIPEISNNLCKNKCKKSPPPPHNFIIFPSPIWQLLIIHNLLHIYRNVLSVVLM